MHDEESPLAQVKKPLLWAGIVLAAIAVLSVVLAIAWDLFVVPVWHMPDLTVGEAVGASVFVCLYTAIHYLLKDEA